MFLGTYLVRVTSGSRVSVPSSFRQELGESFILAKWYEGCLVLIGKSYWEVLLKRITAGVETLLTPVREIERFIFTSAYEMTADEQGRIVIPERLVSYAGLGGEVYFLGVRDRVEIWNRVSWEEKEKEIAKEAPSYIEELAKKNGKR
ncbi:hypothetical protein A2210_02030 [Candidatus Woesebacteria bacterium RIFOXYA1_FULL_40_18]|uniref:Transcriptional regulator MraZ n=4 Tax=Candidatus Woeseibacteriota TaxID=1752722 RepID=A0A1F8CIV6_9BACT|nr:MAG: hypothetical protein A2210_02030 [Candidatus Woesebacteria bacterium RIFOXYA1_FULL_40_18]OGM81422.1 MAG: hypothetical protein A2361_01820 [Candidatus Woesebacteria bacterium RIFOXYB1_FULL_40_26]